MSETNQAGRVSLGIDVAKAKSLVKMSLALRRV
jgi:hypothetical protein